MTWRDAIYLAVSSLRGSLARTLLTVLGLGVGVGAVLTVLTLGAAGEVRVEDEIAKLGVDKIWLRGGSGAQSLRLEDVHTISEETGAMACAGVYGMSQVVMEGASVVAQLAGYDENMNLVHAPKILAGRGLLAEEFASGAPVCLVDESLAERLGGEVVGKRVTIAGRRLLVTGVIKRMTIQTMSGGGGMCIMPLQTYLDTLGGAVAEITICVPREQQAELLADRAVALLNHREGLRADTLEKEIGAAREVVRIFVAVLVCVAGVCMLTGGIGVMNVLLISVRERRGEIGLIKAIGGTSWQVGLLFLLEASAYAVVGGLMGTLIGWTLTKVLGAWIGLEASLRMGQVAAVLLAASLLGAGAGVVPALKASALPPVEALKCD